MSNLSPVYMARVHAFVTRPSDIRSRSEWITYKHVGVYIRCSTRYLEHLDSGFARYETVEIANVSVQADVRKQGLYSDLLVLVEASASGRTIYIENVHDPEQYQIYLRRGFTQIGKHGEPACFIKFPKELQ
jgi:N-acetylglutamate synthase-like GNAT family acetyltransferase